MSTAKTTADLFRERGWGVGTKVKLPKAMNAPYVIESIGSDWVVTRNRHGDTFLWSGVDTGEDWSLYRPAPPAPTEEEWREKTWPALEAYRDFWGPPSLSMPEVQRNMLIAIDTLKAKVQP